MPRKNPVVKVTFATFTVWFSEAEYSSHKDDIDVFASRYMFAENIKSHLAFCFYSLEQGPGKGSYVPSNVCDGYHLQGFFKLNVQHDLLWLKKHIHPTAHFEKMRAVCARNYDYCEKDKSHVAGPWEYGTRPGPNEGNQGARVDLEEVKQSLHTVGYLETAKNHFSTFIRYNKGLSAYCKLVGIPIGGKPRVEQTYTILIYGDANVGKTSWLNNHFCDKHYKLSSTTSNTIWCENVIPDGIAMIDDMEGSVMPMRTFKVLVNNASFSIYPRNGDPIEFDPKFLFITAQDHPSQWWPNRYAENIQHYHAVMKRIDTIWHWTKDPETGATIYECEKGESAREIFNRFSSLININPRVKHPSHISPCFDVDIANGVVRFRTDPVKYNPSTGTAAFPSVDKSFDIFYREPQKENNGVSSNSPGQLTSNGTFIIEDIE